jgi:hypothetical protein
MRKLGPSPGAVLAHAGGHGIQQHLHHHHAIGVDLERCQHWDLPSPRHGKKMEKMAIEIVDFPIKNGDFP